jgi:hypothetical protein
MSYSVWSGGGVGGAIQSGDPWTHVEGEKVRGDLEVLAARRAVYPLGGSRNVALQHSSVMDAYDYLDIEIDGTTLQSGMTVQARVEVRVENAATSVTPRIYNVTTATAMVTGNACTATAADFSGTDQKQALSFTPTTGVNKYRLQLTPSNATWRVWGIGYLEILP